VGTYEDLIPTADLVCNLTPDKQHTAVVTAIALNERIYIIHMVLILWKKECKSAHYIVMCPKCPGSEVRVKRGFGVPTLIMYIRE
jgi:ketol-acid reductoisomerase